MTQGAQKILVVLVAGTLISSAVVGHTPQPTRDSTHGRNSQGVDSRDSSPLPFVSKKTHDIEGSDPSDRVAMKQTAPPALAAESFSDWFGKYLETKPDLSRLRHELEKGLAQISVGESLTGEPDESAAIEAIRRAEQTAGTDYRSLMDRADRLLELYPLSPHREEVKELFAKYARAWDAHEFQEAGEFSQVNPPSFSLRVARYQDYIEHHASAGEFTAQAHAAIEAIRIEWARHDYVSIYDFASRYPSDLASVAARARRYVEDHPASRYLGACEQFLALFEKAAAPGEYRVRVKSGAFSKSVAHTLSLGPDLAVEIEVAGVRIGRTPIVADSYEPAWNYEFPQKIRWRLGDPIRIRVIDFDYSNRTILKIEPPADDPLAIRFLAGPLTADGHRLVFESDFQVPTLPAP